MTSGFELQNLAGKESLGRLYVGSKQPPEGWWNLRRLNGFSGVRAAPCVPFANPTRVFYISVASGAGLLPPGAGVGLSSRRPMGPVSFR